MSEPRGVVVVLALAALMGGCERTLEERCASAAVAACCLLSAAEAEATLGGAVGPAQAAQADGYSMCTYTVSDGRFAELVLFEPGGAEEMRSSRLRQLLEDGRVRGAARMPIPNFAGAEGFWVENLAFPDARERAFFVTAGAHFFRIAATPLGDGWPDWKRARDLSRPVLRNLNALGSTDTDTPSAARPEGDTEQD